MDEQKDLIAKHIFFFEQLENGILPLDTYIFDLSGFKLYLKKGEVFDKSKRDELLNEGQKYLFISKNELREYNFNVEKKLTQTLSNKDIPVKKRTEILRNASISLVEEVFDSMEILKDKERIDNLTNNMVQFLNDNKGVLFNLLTLSSHDFYTYRHSVDVSIYNIMFAKFIGITNKKQLNIYAQAGLFHDLGKSRVPDKIINKKGPLNDEEWKIMKSHPKYGADILKNIYGIHQNIIDASLYHHEKIDGSGYPFGLSGDKIPFIGRLTAISDIFSALTTHRSYSKARSIYEALNFMTENLRGKIDKQLFKKFIQMFQTEKEKENG
jgi:putative nucleotidyltransferase with HDIG domain